MKDEEFEEMEAYVMNMQNTFAKYLCDATNSGHL